MTQTTPIAIDNESPAVIEGFETKIFVSVASFTG
jgi:hypothetical protein